MSRLALAALLSVLLSSAAAAADVRSGAAKAVSGDTLEIGGQTVELHGIDAPELDAKCIEWRGTRQVNFPCGLHAKAYLMSLVAGEEVACVAAEQSGGRAICYARGIDLAEALVSAGWALACDYANRYISVGNDARTAKIGMWSGNFTLPNRCRP